MRISDWSSDVCSSDLRIGLAVAIVLLLIPGRVQGLILRPLFRGQRCLSHGNAGDAAEEFVNLIALLDRQPWRGWALWLGWRSEERRVGQECVRTCRSRWSADP